MLKKLFTFFIAISIILNSFAIVYAEDKKGVLMQINNNDVFIITSNEEKKLNIDSNAIILNNNTYVPARTIVDLFNGSIDWNKNEQKITLKIDNNTIEMWLDKNISSINGIEKNINTPPKLVNSITYIPLRFISENIGLKVLFSNSDNIIYISNYDISLSELENISAINNFKKPMSNVSAKESVSYNKKMIQTSSGNISANVITIDLSNPNIIFDVVMPENKLNTTDSFSNIVKNNNAIAAVNGNFFGAYSLIKDPVGTIMSKGEYLFISSGLPSMGVTKNNSITFGEPAIFTKVYTTDNDNNEEQIFTAFELNVLNQDGEQSVLYTLARGTSVNITNSGAVMIIEDNVIKNYYKVNSGDQVVIPNNGYVFYFSDHVLNYPWHVDPQVGRKVTIKQELFKPDSENFDLTNVLNVVSGAPRLIKNGTIDNSPLPNGFDGDQRFISNSAGRTAVGKTQDGKLLLVNCNSTISQLKEIMLGLNCFDAINIDGGASTGMYYDGNYISTPGRQLTSVIIIKEK